MYNNNFGNCRGCGQHILWIKTKAGRSMPVNTTIHHYKIDKAGHERIVTEDGSVVTGTIVDDPQNADGMGYISHFATCPHSRNFKSRAAR